MEEKELLLREDRRLLGRLLGEVIRSQAGATALERIERIRQTAVRFRKEDQAHEGGSRLMRAEAADKIIDILRETPPPAGRLPGPLMRAGNRPAFKTGTSYGFRDALAVGVAGGYAVMVWTGRPDGGARADQTGREAAAPLLFAHAQAWRAPNNAMATAPRQSRLRGEHNASCPAVRPSRSIHRAPVISGTQCRRAGGGASEAAVKRR